MLFFTRFAMTVYKISCCTWVEMLNTKHADLVHLSYTATSPNTFNNPAKCCNDNNGSLKADCHQHRGHFPPPYSECLQLDYFPPRL